MACVLVLCAVAVLGAGVPARADTAPDHVNIAPQNVTWDGLNVVVIGGYASEISYYLPDVPSIPRTVACTDVDGGGVCPINVNMDQAGQVIRVTATLYDAGHNEVASDVFDIKLAVHVELGYWSLQGLKDKLDEVAGAVKNQFAFNPDGPGVQAFMDQMNRLNELGPMKLAKSAAHDWTTNQVEPDPVTVTPEQVTDRIFSLPLDLVDPWHRNTTRLWFKMDFKGAYEVGTQEGWDKLWRLISMIQTAGFAWFILRRVAPVLTID